MAETLRETKEEKERRLREELHLGWLEHPRTQELLRILEDWLEQERDKWEDGLLTAESKDGTLQLNAEAIGACQRVRKILGLCRDFEAFEQETEDEGEQQRT